MGTLPENYKMYRKGYQTGYHEGWFETKERLKADMVAMLTDLKNKLIDKSWNINMYDDDLDFECCYLTDIDEIIQQKINALKAETKEDLIAECKRLDGDCTRCSHKHNCCSSEYNGRH